AEKTSCRNCCPSQPSLSFSSSHAPSKHYRRENSAKWKRVTFELSTSIMDAISLQPPFSWQSHGGTKSRQDPSEATFDRICV
ncbi:hypothetical protein ATANTOWER_012990, partial [Ataeniobius toweri]|nr:hypothetical protein [Ataeniobius toweri]